MKRLLIVAHIPSDNTRALRDAVVRGASHDEIDGVEVVSLTLFEAGPEVVRAANAVILGTTENLVYMSGALKDFFIGRVIQSWKKSRGCPMRFISVLVTMLRVHGAVLRPSLPG